ncbi:MAG: folate-binding protein [Rhodospirillaceae bacterium]|nr:folate-binding protein [Rhodospirillaceae bacterium]
MSKFHIADDRVLLRVTGSNRIDLLQGVISNDVLKVSEDRAIWAAFLTPQGKYLHDFFVISDGESLLLDGEKGRIGDLQKRLRRYTLRLDARVEVEDDLAVAVDIAALPPDLDQEDLIVFRDPRVKGAGNRYIGEASLLIHALRAAGLTEASSMDWDAHRLVLGLPDGARDFRVEKSTLPEGNADLLGAIDWQKGCWMGQEVTARMHYRGLVKRRMMPMKIEGPAPNPGAPVMKGNLQIGECRSSAGGMVMTIVRSDGILNEIAGGQTQPLMSGESRLRPAPPAWLIAALAGNESACQTA